MNRNATKAVEARIAARDALRVFTHSHIPEAHRAEHSKLVANYTTARDPRGPAQTTTAERMGTGVRQESTMKRLILVLALVGCTSLLGPVTGTYPPGTVQYSPLDSFPQYLSWWAKVQQCTGTTMAFSDLNWFVVKDRFNFEHGGQIVYGYFTVPMNIVLADDALETESMVEHEMVHAALYQMFGDKYYNAKDAHPAEYFKQRCGFVAQNPEGS